MDLRVWTRCVPVRSCVDLCMAAVSTCAEEKPPAAQLIYGSVSERLREEDAAG